MNKQSPHTIYNLLKEKKEAQRPDNFNEEDNSFFKKDTTNPLYTNTDKRVIRNNLILDLIKKNAPITPYALTKMVKWSYTEVCRVIRDLEYVGLIQVKIVLGDNNRANKLLTIPEGDQKND